MLAKGDGGQKVTTQKLERQWNVSTKATKPVSGSALRLLSDSVEVLTYEHHSDLVLCTWVEYMLAYLH